MLAGILAIAACLRLVPGTVPTVEHFDEGVYASNLWFGAEDGFRYPQQHLYAPPLLPWLIEWTMILRGVPAGETAVWPSLAAGVATIAGIWWLTRLIHSVGAAHLAAGLAAVSGSHVLLSRAALTDAMLLLWFVLALGCFVRGWRSGRWRDFGISGLMVGLAWWTKYNGWLPLLISLLAIVAGAVRERSWTDRVRRFGRWGIAAAIAVLIWSPYLLALRAHGGYAAVAANHQKYIVGPTGWWTSLSRQLANLSYLDPWLNLDLVALAVGAVGAGAVCVRSLSGESESAGHSALTAGTSPGASRGTASPAYLLVPVWFGCLALMTPMYTPYLRLMLPLLAAGWVASGMGIAMLVGWLTRNWTDASAATSRAAALRWLAGGGCLIVAVASPGLSRVWEDRGGLAAVAREVAPRVTAADSPLAVVYVYGEPALLFQLRAAGVPVVVPVQSVALQPAQHHATSLPVPTYLITGPHADRSPTFRSQWTEYRMRYELVATFSYRPSPLVALDNTAPSQLSRPTRPEEVIQLYRIR